MPEPAEPSRDDVLRDIQREAEENDIRRQDMEGLKNNARGLLLTEAIARVEEKRAPFRKELSQLIAELGNDAGEEIEKLCDRYGKEALPQVKIAYARSLRAAPKRLTQQGRVELMRSLGVPEPLILDQLCHDFDKLINTRGGPRTEREVRVRAAQSLLRIPLTPPRRLPSGAGGPRPAAVP